MSRHFSDSISEGDLADRGDVMPPREPVHFVAFDEPSATSRRLQKAVCATWVHPREVAFDRDAVTCPECQAHMDASDALEF